MASQQSHTLPNGMADAVMSDVGERMGWGGGELGGNGAFVNPYPHGGGVGGMGMVIPNRMYNMPVARGVEMAPGVPPPPYLSREEMLEHVEEAERLRKTLTVWHATHHDALVNLRNQMQRADVTNATAATAANIRIQALEAQNLALRDAALASDEQMAACKKELQETTGKYKQYKREYVALQKKYNALKQKHDTPDADNNDLPAGMAGPATA